MRGQRCIFGSLSLRPGGSRLDVLRGLIADVTNAAKTSKPVASDGQMLSIIRKRVKNSEAAVQEFQNANRDDLKDREVAQIAVLESYIGENGSMGEEDITRVIQDVIGTLRTEEKNVNQGSVMKALVGPGGSLESQAVDNQVVAKLVKGESCLLFSSDFGDCDGGIKESRHKSISKGKL